MDTTEIADLDIEAPGDPDVVVLRRGAHGMSTETYAEALRERLPEHQVARASTPQQEAALVAQAPIVTGHRLPPDVLEAAENLELFACAAAGVGHLPLEELAARDVVVTNASGVHGPNIAEYVIGTILAFTRNFHQSWRQDDRSEWRHHQSRELADSTVTVVGMGAIGQAIVERLEPFDVRTIGLRYSPEKGGPTDHVLGFEEADVHRALSVTDYLVLACPLTDETRGLIGPEEFDTLPPESVIINVGRGPIVDTDALVQAIQGNAIRGAGLDVTDPEPLPQDHPLWTFENVHVTPHNAGHTPEYYPRLADIVAHNVDLFDDGRLDEEAREQVENRVQ